MRPLSNHILGLVKSRFRDAFTRFIDTGELDDSFAEYLNQDPGCQAAIEAIAKEQLDSLREFGRSLREDSRQSAAVEPESAAAPAAQIASTDARVEVLYDLVISQHVANSVMEDQAIRRALASKLVSGA
jgi:hypothetical protein